MSEWGWFDREVVAVIGFQPPGRHAPSRVKKVLVQAKQKPPIIPDQWVGVVIVVLIAILLYAAGFAAGMK